VPYYFEPERVWRDRGERLEPSGIESGARDCCEQTVQVLEFGGAVGVNASNVGRSECTGFLPVVLRAARRPPVSPGACEKIWCCSSGAQV
jgi:hypothetical protein